MFTLEIRGGIILTSLLHKLSASKACAVYELHWNQIEFNFHRCTAPIIDCVGNIITFCLQCTSPFPICCRYFFRMFLLSYFFAVRPKPVSTVLTAKQVKLHYWRVSAVNNSFSPANCLYHLLSLVLPLTMSSLAANYLYESRYNYRRSPYTSQVQNRSVME
jgi:hypothetical protein